ncbi:MAG: hypothetical protein V1729_02200 [Candidatus Woesearchaeota archaeon]
MAGKKSVIETGVDKLVTLVNDREKISVKDAAKELGVSVASIEEWSDFLEEEGIISVQTHLATVYIVRKQIGKKELAEKVAAVRDEKEEFLRDVESSVNAIERDHEEIKLVDNEFRKIKSLIEHNFEDLSGKLKKLEDFRKTHSDIESKRREMESEYTKKIGSLEGNLKKDEKEYKRVIDTIEQELEEMKKERARIETMKVSEKVIQDKVSEINRMVASVQKEIQKENEQLDVDEERLKKSEGYAKKIRDDIDSNSREIDDITKKMHAARKEVEELEKDFMKDVSLLGKGDLEKLGVYKEGKVLLEKFHKFFSQTKEVEELIRNAERSEEELSAQFDKLSKKTRAFSVVTSVPEVKKQIAALRTELLAIESKKSSLSSNLKKLRGLMRSVTK